VKTKPLPAAADPAAAEGLLANIAEELGRLRAIDRDAVPRVVRVGLALVKLRAGGLSWLFPAPL
jgi:hypothetical protein